MQHTKNNKKAIVLLSGGLDSTTALYLAVNSGYKPYCLIFDIGQRHKKEINCAKKTARRLNVPYKLARFALPWKGSSLLDKNIPLHVSGKTKGIPATYIPARNTIFIAFALSWADAIGAKTIFIGANAIDFSGYPDCRPEYFNAYNNLIKKALKHKYIELKTPLLHKTKAAIIKTGLSMGVPYRLTWSCYAGGRKPCGKCDSCRLRAKGFKEAGIEDPLI